MIFSPEKVLARLSEPPRVSRYRVGFSGGLDSTVLLQTLALLRQQLPAPFEAVHVHHGLHPEADRWAAHCRAVAAELGAPFSLLRIDARALPGESPEAAARAARYQVIEAALAPDEILLTAHQQDDQAETLLLQLLRGAGPAGLAAMPRCRRFGGGWHVRPLLDIPRAELRRHAETHSWSWIEDTSNRDTRVDRNFLRQAVIPQLRHHWPAATSQLARAAGHQAQFLGLLREIGREDRSNAAATRAGTLSIKRLQRLSAARRNNVLRTWIDEHDLPPPRLRHVRQILDEVVGARADAEPCVCWPGAEVRRYRDDLYAMAPLSAHDPGSVLDWDSSSPLRIPHLGLTLTADTLSLPMDLIGARVSVRFRQGGERCRPWGRAQHHDLKKLFQEAGVPPWERNRIPLIYVGDKLMAVAGYWTCW